MQKLGQHFLKNTAVLQKIVDALALADGDRVVEIGPGHGELTMPLAHAARGKHCEIFCIEKDHSLIGGLEQLTAEENATTKNTASGDTSGASRMNIIEGDALKLLPDMTATKIVGNIPYYITGKLLRIMSELEKKPERIVLLIQKEVAERICVAPPDMNRLAASVQFWADARIIAHVPRKDFSPAPDVDSAVIALDAHRHTHKDIDPALYYRAVRAIFAQPRKTLLNNLFAWVGKTAKKNDVDARIKKFGIDPDARPQDLSIDQIVLLASMDLWE